MIQLKMTGAIDYKKIEKAMSDDIILIGHIRGEPHNSYQGNPVEDVSDIAIKMTYGTTAVERYNGRRDGAIVKVNGVPARPYLEEGIMSELALVQKAIEKGYGEKIDGKSAWMKKIGVICVNAVSRFMTGDFYRGSVPNSQQVIDAKGSDKPLIDTGQLMQSVTFLENSKPSGYHPEGG
jgi:hypothetical protein